MRRCVEYQRHPEMQVSADYDDETYNHVQKINIALWKCLACLLFKASCRRSPLFMDESLAACSASAARKITKIRFVRRSLLLTKANVAISDVFEERRWQKSGRPQPSAI